MRKCFAVWGKKPSWGSDLGWSQDVGGPLIYTLQHVSLWSLNDFVLCHMAAENNHQKLGALFSNYT